MKRKQFYVLFFMTAILFCGNAYGNVMLRTIPFGTTNSPESGMSGGINNIASAKQYLEEHLEELDPIEGIYSVDIKMTTSIDYGDYVETFDMGQHEFAIVKRGKAYAVVGLSNNKAFKSIEIERIGETNAYNFIIRYNSGDKSYNRLLLESMYAFTVNNVKMPYGAVKYDNGKEVADISKVTWDFEFIKDFPTRSMYESVITKKQPDLASGTGFALGNGYVVTNHHVIDGAKGISVKGIKGIMNSGYAAEVVASDKVNDIAILKIADYRFDGFGTIPYSVSTRMADVGEEVFVLGYPLTQALGNEIKLTNGIVSSRTGYQGDVSTYQMSAPVQPGNSGGPMFDSKGNIIGIVVAGVPGAENVGYAIKTSYLKILIESAGLNVKLPSKNSISALSLSEKVKRVKNMVLYIECGR
ncbi:MAG: trypsin-like peptidase domain-containing protein [Bacteroidales bacterium]|nr:trypsin-like peptidase domain-containing protein [Bacteroidales bacterium]